MLKPRDEARLNLGDAAVFSLNRAAELLPFSDGEARTWLEARGLIRHINGRAVVRWRDVLDALCDNVPKAKPRPSQKREPLPRVRLGG